MCLFNKENLFKGVIIMEIKLELSDKRIEFLKQYARVYEQEREFDWTADPIVVVEREIRIPTRDGLEDDCSYLWITEDEENEFDNLYDLETAINESRYVIKNKDLQQLLCNLRDGIEDEVDELGKFIINYYVKSQESVAYFLTIAEAEKYMEYQNHNLQRTSINVRHMGYSNRGDLVEFSKMLLEIGKMLNKEEE